MRTPGWIARWISRRVAIALALAGALVVLLVAAAREPVRVHGRAFDRAAIDVVRRFDSGPADVVMRGFTELGSVWIFSASVIGVALFAVRRRASLLALAHVAVAVVSALLNTGLKLYYQRARPALFDEIERPESFSFPSGHAMVSTSIYGMAAVVISRLVPKLRAPLAVATPLVVLMIGLSRVYLGVHWPTDVLAGFTAGTVVLGAGWLAISPARAPGDVSRPATRPP